MADRIFVVIAGNIGTGKTTLTNMLAERFQWKAHYEAVKDNPYLDDFYADMARWSFPLQVFFLTNRFQTHNEINQGNASAIQDRSIYEDANIFARNLFEAGKMDQRDYESYLELYEKLTRYLNPPDLVIYLRKSVPKLRDYIKKRGRSFEQGIEASYLERLNHYYEEWIRGYKGGKVLVVDSNELDFVANPAHFDGISRLVREALDQKELFPPTA